MGWMLSEYCSPNKLTGQKIVPSKFTGFKLPRVGNLEVQTWKLSRSSVSSPTRARRNLEGGSRAPRNEPK